MAATPIPSSVRNTVLGAVLLVLFLASLDQTIVGTALPHIVSELHGASLYTWVVTSYLLTSTVTVPLYGKFSDVYGRKPMLLVGVVLFLIGSALSGQARDMNQLIFFRGVQGLGAGALFPVSLAIIGDLFSARERGRYQGLFGAVFGVSFIVGPFLGGFLTDNANWRWVFYVNLPVGVVALAVIAFAMPSVGRRIGSPRDLDYVGIAVLTLALVPLLIGLTNKGQTDSSGHLYDWTTWQVGGLIAFSVVALAVFVLVERRVREPLIPLDLFTDRTTAATNLAVFFLGFGMFTAVIYLPRFYQVVRGVSATQSGYEIWPLLVGLMGGSILTGQLISRTGRYRILLVGSLAIFIAGALLMTNLQADTNNVLLWAWMLVLGLGVGPGMAGFTVVIQSVVPLRRLGVATSTLTLFRQIGGTVSLAIAGTLFNSTFSNELPKRLVANGVPNAAAQQFTDSGAGAALSTVANQSAALATALPAQLRPLIPAIVNSLHQAETAAIAQLFWLSLGAGVAALACTLVIREQPLRGGPSLREEHAANEGAEAPPVPVAAA
jgi:EmrB/QacA subfamily drug resistance transporter